MPLTQKDRLKGAEKSRIVRRKKQAKRRKKAKALYDTGMPKAKIARTLGVHRGTIIEDLKATE